LYRFRGVPFDVAQDVTSTFCCRVTNLRTNQVADRTFSLTVTGQDAPTIINNVVELGQVFDGTYAEFQITAIDLDREPLTYYISSGTLPPGLSLNKNTGLISGVVEPNEILEIGSLMGWSTASAWDQEPWDFGSKAISKRFEFDVSVTDTKDIVSKKFSIYVVSKDSLTADNDVIQINGYYDFITADVDVKRNPVLTTISKDLGTYAHNNYFAYRFTATDFDGDYVSFSLLVAENIGFDNETNGFDSTLLDLGESELPPGLTLSEETGWLYGNLTDIGAIQKEYQFGVYVYKRDYPQYKSALVQFNLTLVGDLRYVVNWVSPEFLGNAIAGEVSELSVEATNVLGKRLIYSLEVGSNSRLPQGLKLLDNGLIAGRASFEVTTFDQNTLTFDKNVREAGAFIPETTVDRDYTFTVRASDLDNDIIAYKTFRIKLTSVYNRPYESLYLRAYPGFEDKELYNQLVFNSDIIPNDFVYRAGDPFFGKQRTLDMLVIAGINPSEAREYIEAMAVNHYRKKLLIGEPEIAQALDSEGNVKYEVLYLPMRDDGGPVAKSLDLRTKIKRNITTDNLNPSVDLNYFNINTYDKVVYPNGLNAMREQIRSKLGYVDREVLPTWMRSKQENGIIPYWNPAVVLAYLKPGTGKQVKFLINRLFDYDIKDISFEVDRYVWDCNLSSVYNPVTDEYFNSNLTTFDSDVRQGSDTLTFSFTADGSTKVFDTNIQIETGIVEVIIEKYILLSDSSISLDRSIQIENVDFTRNDNFITFTTAPEVNSTVIVNYTSSILLTTDYAVTVPFNKIDGMPSSYITNVLGGFDSAITVYEGKTIIFARQEQYAGYIEPNDGWVQNNVMWDDGQAWDNPEIGWDDYRVIPGYNENQADQDVANERAGIWEVTVNSFGLIRLIPIGTAIPGQRIQINNGTLYGGKILRYGPLIRFDVGETVPNYRVISEKAEGKETIFDGGSTRFVESINVYQTPDEGDKYLAFPRVNIFA
jgi:hypothetical protein